uniref:Uncharacterized protein n=1 Tax=Sphenodon punctatus TaxID=8508 RepID=A0A8D0GY59_SPHPU
STCKNKPLLFPQRNYEQLKEEHDIGVVSTVHPVTPTVINMHYGPPPRDHLVWSIFTTIYMNVCCLGFMALVFSVKARDRKVLGDNSGALSYGSTSKCLNLTALLLTLLFVVVIIILLATTIIQASLWLIRKGH